MSKILVVDEDSKAVGSLINLLKSEDDFQVSAVLSRDQALNRLADEFFHVVITDDNSNVDFGKSIIEQVVEQYAQTQCIIYASQGSITGAVQAMKKGACDYLNHPSDPSIILSTVKAAVAKASLDTPKRRRTDSAPGVRFGELVGESPKILKVFNAIDKVAKTDSTVLITGESGTGKELIARAIHYNSARCNKPMVVINCGAIPGELLESELFGHEKGAFTGAHRTRVGRFEMADTGTIFLDEIGDMSPDLQVKLLRVLQEQSFERVGSTKTIRVNIRVLAATNKDLISSINDGTFREDLYYRLNVIPVTVPPLRERKSDIPLLVNFFLKRLGGRRRQDRRRMKTLSEDAVKMLMEYDWPGNIRELENMIERLSVLVEESVIQTDDLPERIRGRTTKMRPTALESLEDGIDFNGAVEHYQKSLILEALNQTDWVKAKAADLLKMNRTTLVEKIKKMNLEAVRVSNKQDSL